MSIKHFLLFLALVLGFLAKPRQALAWPAALLNDSEVQNTEHLFPSSPEIDAAVIFWRDLFTRHSSDRIVFHDRLNLDVVWEVIELPKDENGEIIEAQTGEFVRQKTLELKTRLARLEKTPQPQDENDSVLLTLVGGADSNRLLGAAERVRAQRGVADKFQVGLERARSIFSEIQSVLRAENVPVELAALPFVESMYNPNAHSSAGAAGLWQLMPATARLLGLQVSSSLDERWDVAKATRAAAKMLRQNYQMLGTWPLAITGYNHGPYGVKRAVLSVGSTDLGFLIRTYEKASWGFASKNFYAEFLAATQILSDQNKDFSVLVQKEPPPNPEAQIQ